MLSNSSLTLDIGSTHGVAVAGRITSTDMMLQLPGDIAQQARSANTEVPGNKPRPAQFLTHRPPEKQVFPHYSTPPPNLPQYINTNSDIVGNNGDTGNRNTAADEDVEQDTTIKFVSKFSKVEQESSQDPSLKLEKKQPPKSTSNSSRKSPLDFFLDSGPISGNSTLSSSGLSYEEDLFRTHFPRVSGPGSDNLCFLSDTIAGHENAGHDPTMASLCEATLRRR